MHVQIKNPIMKRKVFNTIVFSCCLFIFSLSNAQVGGNAIYNSNTLYQIDPAGVDLNLNTYNYSFSNLLEANVMINLKASSYVAIFSLSQQGKTIEEAEGAMQNRLEIFKKLLEQNNIAPQQLFIDPVSLVPVYEIEVLEKKVSKTFNEVPAGFEIKKSIHITFTDHTQINQLISIAARAEVYDLVKVDYVLQDMDQVLSRLRQEAMKILLNKKDELEKTGMHMRFTQLGEKYGSVYPIERYTQYIAYKAGMSPIIKVRNNKEQQQVQYNYAEKNRTIYYEKVSDKQFDKVINPVVSEPEVQVYLSLKAQYQFFDPETEKLQKANDDSMKQLQLEEMKLRVKEKEKDIELKGKKITGRK
jgi:uncharacterized protein YggE